MIERPPLPGVHFVFHDPSGGASDSTCLGIARRDGNVIVVEALREIGAPHDPESAIAEFAALLKLYGVREVTGDRYSARWNASAWERHGVRYKHSELNKSDLYLNLLPLLNSRGIRLLEIRARSISCATWNGAYRAAVATASTTRRARMTTLPT